MFRVSNVEFWSRWYDWNHPKKWHFGIDRNCFNKCIIIELGFFGLTILKGECQE